MKLQVHIKDQNFPINCGEGNQKIRWIGDVALYRYEHFFGQVNGTPKGVRFENGELLDMDYIINQTLEDDMHVWVILKDDLEGLGLDKEIKKKPFAEQQKNDFIIRPVTPFTGMKQKK